MVWKKFRFKKNRVTKMRFGIKSEKLEHKDQTIDLDFSEMKILDLNFDFKNEIVFDKYNGKSAWAKYLGPSRIDGCPMFQIDTFQLDREEKIEQILK